MYHKPTTMHPVNPQVCRSTCIHCGRPIEASCESNGDVTALWSLRCGPADMALNCQGAPASQASEDGDYEEVSQ